MNTKRIIVRLTRPVRRRFERAMRKTDDADLRTRIQIVLHYHRGWGSNRIAEALGCVPATAIRVIHRFLDDGEDGLLDGRRENGQPKVDEDLVQALAELIAGSPEDHGWPRPTWTRELLAKTLRKRTGVRVSVSTVARMLVRLQARWGMARPTVLCPWPKAQKTRRVRAILEIVEHLSPGEVAFYEDEVDIHLNPKIGRDWMLRGQQKVVVTPGQNRKRFIAGALAVDGSNLVTVAGERKNTGIFIDLLERLRHTHPKARRIHLVLDNYCIHSSRRLQKYLAEHPDLFVLHFLPPYCPDDNRIERVWRELHANVTRNHRCRSMGELMKRVRAYLHREARRRRSEANAGGKDHGKLVA